MMFSKRENPYTFSRFVDDYGRYLMKRYNLKWRSCFITPPGIINLQTIPHKFILQIGNVCTSSYILRKLLVERFSNDFNIALFWNQDSNVNAMLYVKRCARIILSLTDNPLLLCAFAGQVSTLSAMENHADIAHLPLQALSEILYEENLVNTDKKWENFCEVDYIPNEHCLETEQQSLVSSYPNGVSLSCESFQDKLLAYWSRKSSSNKCRTLSYTVFSAKL
ncbi:unnamed protein product [Larinioides sclopetarius]|uniref:Uncharacterized protein n=1 Tax=Larinioides sclopetarius TaxID=280406 RepID=A0AAV1YRB7_9ARAC